MASSQFFKAGTPNRQNRTIAATTMTNRKRNRRAEERSRRNILRQSIRKSSFSRRSPPWSAAAWRRFGLDQAPSITKRRQAAALQGGALRLNTAPKYRLKEPTSNYISVADSVSSPM